MKYRLNSLSKNILHGGLALSTGCYFLVMLHIRNSLMHGVVTAHEVSFMLEHVTMTLLLVVVFSLTLDIHIKSNTRGKK